MRLYTARNVFVFCLINFLFTKEYKLSGVCHSGESDPMYKGEYGDSQFLFMLRFASTKIRSEKEVWAYRTLSFLANQGGSLSLFVGVSLLSVWDSVECFVTRYYKART